MVQDLYQECYEILLQLPEIYQPVLAPGLMHLKSKRLCSDRLELIINDLKDKEASINDIGCQIGFFSLSLAKMGHVVHGYDMDDKNIRICKLLNELNDIPNKPTFTKVAFGVETTDCFDSADYSLCLAVFHHIIHLQGLDVAKDLIITLRSKTKKKLYFEIGQSNESVEPWSKYLPDMGMDPFLWIADFLRNGGFKNIQILGRVPTHLTEVPRYLVSAS